MNLKSGFYMILNVQKVVTLLGINNIYIVGNDDKNNQHSKIGTLCIFERKICVECTE